ncbi:MAG: DNA polymerase Y family protein [Alphaproteobacteria bacterium]|nr:DNA polymerase Y family protein [Alphaproteobacteria bacterium]MBL6671394.1 DNA polymerase Y family protein [Alphaproteobacteria bacterium]
MTRLIIHAWFPHLAAERVRRTSDVSPMHPLVLTRAVHGAELVDSVCVLARRLGLRGGMRLADARALRPDLLSHPADDAADRQDLQHLAMWARRYCPLTAPAPAGITGGGASIAHDGNGIWLDVAGATHLHGGIRPLLADMARRLRRAGLTIRLAVAPTCGAAWGLARYAPAAQRYGCSRHSASSSRQLSAMLAGLPLAALRLDGTVCTAMAASGLRHVGDLLGMARAPLASRFGQVVTHQLDAALGHVNESFTPLMPARPRVAMRQFAEPVAAPEDIQVIASGLAGEMVDILQQQGLATRRLQLGWQRVDNMVMGRDVHFSRPSLDSGAFCRLLVSAAETIDPEFGLERMWLEAHDCSPQAPVAARFDEGISASETYASLVDRLVARLGYGAVLHMRARNCWQPEAAQYAAYADMETAGFHDDMNTTPHCLTAAPRPIRLLGVPQKLAVVALLPDHPPARFVWQKRTHKVIRASGPERIAPQWWSAAVGTRTRDYFRLQDEDGARFWVYREGLPERGEEPDWFLHGFFA